METHVQVQLLPRFIRFRDAPRYLGMDRNRFNSEVRPFIREIPIGIQGIAFDRIDLDKWADYYKQHRARSVSNGRLDLWDAKKCQGSSSEEVFGTLTSKFSDAEFAKVLEQTLSRKRKGT